MIPNVQNAPRDSDYNDAQAIIGAVIVLSLIGMAVTVIIANLGGLL